MEMKNLYNVVDMMPSTKFYSETDWLTIAVLQSHQELMEELEQVGPIKYKA